MKPTKPTKKKQQPKLTDKDRVAQAISAFLSEYVDDFAFVGFIAGTDEPLCVTHTASKKGQLALEAGLADVEIPPHDKDDETYSGS